LDTQEQNLRQLIFRSMKQISGIHRETVRRMVYNDLRIANTNDLAAMSKDQLGIALKKVERYLTVTHYE